MEVEVHLFGPFRDAVGEKVVSRPVPSDAAVGDVLAALADEHSELAGRFRTDDGELRGDVNVTRNGTHVRQLDGLETPLSDGDLLRIAPPVKGG